MRKSSEPSTPPWRNKWELQQKGAGGSVKIIGKSAPIRIFIEGVPQGVTITPLIVKDLSHPINVGRDFLGRNKGRLEFTPSDGYLEINQVKVRMIKKATPLASPQVVDPRFRKTFRNPGSYVHHHTEMIYEGTINQCEDVTDRPVPMYSRDEVVVPVLSGMFVPITTRGKIMLKDARKFELTRKERRQCWWFQGRGDC